MLYTIKGQVVFGRDRLNRRFPWWRGGLYAIALAASHDALGAESSLAEDARQALAKATTYIQSIASEGGYLWTYSPDLTRRAGERPATATQIWVQPPGTPEMGSTFLRLYEVTGERQYLEAARAAAEALARGQLESGGWDYVIDFSPEQTRHWYRRTDVGRLGPAEIARRRNISTYDDDTTQSALRLLLAVGHATRNSSERRDELIREARDYGLAKLLAAQRPNGGWPQRWDGVPVDSRAFPVQAARISTSYPREHPPRHDYSEYYTLNDHTQRDCVMTLLVAARVLERPEYRAAALRGGDFILLAQLPEPQPAWAQQYNLQLEPAWARSFEPPAVCSSESAGAMRLLLDLYQETNDRKYLEPLPRAIAWFRRSAIAPNTWARLYELGSNRPIYGDRDGKIHYTLEEISAERQSGYSWRGSYGIPDLMALAERVARDGGTAGLRLSASDESPQQRKARARAIEPEVRQAIAALDSQGRWISRVSGSPQIRTATYIANARLLAEYLSAID